MNTIIITILIVLFPLVIALPVIPFAVADAIWEFRQHLKEREKK